MPSTGTPTRTKSRRGSKFLASAVIAGLGLPLVPVATSTAYAAPGASPVEVAPYTAAEVDAAMERLRADGMLFEDSPEQMRAAASVAGLGSKFGSAFFQGIIQGGGRVSFDAILGELGYGSGDQLAEALDDIGRSIDELNAQVQAIAQQIEAVLDGQDKTNFYNSYTATGQTAAAISTAMASVSTWIDYELEPSENNVSDMQTILRSSIGEMEFLTSNPVTGTVPLMQRAAEPSRVTDLDDYWQRIDATRDDYRAVLAQGLATLDTMLIWDTDGTIDADIDTLSPIAMATVMAMYDYGVQPEGPQGQPYVQLRSTDLSLSGYNADVHLHGEGIWSRTNGITRGAMEPILEGMVDAYDPDLHAGITLEQYLDDRGIPTKYVYTDQFHNHVTKSSGVLTRDVSYQVRALLGEIQGNDYQSYTIHVDAKLTNAYQEHWSPWNGWKADGDKGAADQWFSSRRSAWINYAKGHTASWVSTTDAHGRLVTGTPVNNAGGFATDYDPGRIAEAAYGI